MIQLDLLLDYKPRAQLFQFPASRRVTMSHAIAQELTDLDFDSGKKRWQTISQRFQKGLRNEGLSAHEVRTAVDKLAGDVHDAIGHLNLLKQYRSPALILPLKAPRLPVLPHGDGVGAAGTLGEGTKFLPGLGGAHKPTEYDAARAYEGGPK